MESTTKVKEDCKNEDEERALSYRFRPRLSRLSGAPAPSIALRFLQTRSRAHLRSPSCAGDAESAACPCCFVSFPFPRPRCGDCSAHSSSVTLARRRDLHSPEVHPSSLQPNKMPRVTCGKRASASLRLLINTRSRRKESKRNESMNYDNVAPL